VPTFTDNANRVWAVGIDVNALKRVRTICEVDLASAIADGGKILGQLSSDPVLLCDVIFAICKPQADALHVSDVEFGGGMSGDALEAATGALLDGLVDFFPKARRALFAKVIRTDRELEKTAIDLAGARLDDPALKARVVKMVNQSLDKAFGNSSTDAPE